VTCAVLSFELIEEDRVTQALRQQPKYAHAVGCSDIHFAIHNHGGDELVAGSELIATGRGLVAVVQLVKVSGIVGVQNSRGAVFRRPHDGIAGAVGGNARSRAGVYKSVAGLKARTGRKRRIGNSERLDCVPNRAIVDGV
jgi:hypothetical protein